MNELNTNSIIFDGQQKEPTRWWANGLRIDKLISKVNSFEKMSLSLKSFIREDNDAQTQLQINCIYFILLYPRM